MCKLKNVETDKSETIETSNYGLLNFSEDNLGTMGLVEILVIILLLGNWDGLGVLFEEKEATKTEGTE